MAYNYEYPYTDPNRYNADWLLNEMKDLLHKWSEFVPTHTITFGGVWTSNKSYLPYTIVTAEGKSYISKKAVPLGVLIENREYWEYIGSYNIVEHWLLGTSLHAYTTVEDMKNDDFLKNGYICVTTGYHIPGRGGSLYMIRDTVPEKHYIVLNNGLYAETICYYNGKVDITTFGAKGNYDDISNLLYDLISYGVTDIYIPSGHYSMEVQLDKKIKLSGDAEYRTYIHPVNNEAYMLTINAPESGLENVLLEHLTFNAYDKRANGILIKGRLDHSFFNDIDIINCFYSFSIQARMIWNRFNNLRIMYCHVGLLQYSGEYVFNLNSFHDCTFSNCQQSGVDLRNNGENTTFYSCNFERNCLGGIVGIYGDLRSSNGSMACYGCYFEKEYTSENTHFGLEINDCILSVNGCSFTHYATLARLIGGSCNLIGNSLRYITSIFHNNTTAKIFTCGNQFTQEQIQALVTDGRKIMESEYYS